MNSIDRKKVLIAEKRQELKKRYGPNPVLFCSGRGIETEKEYPEKLRINLNPKVIQEFFPESD